MAKKLTEALSLSALKARYAVEYGGPQQFITALEDGSIEALIKECADAMYGGDYLPVLKAMKKNCADNICRRGANYRTITNSQKANGDKAIDALNDYLTEMVAKVSNTRPNVTKRTTRTWRDWSIEELQVLDDYDTAFKLYNCLSSAISNATLETTEEELAEIRAKRDIVRERRNALKEAALQPKETIQVSEDLLSKLSGTGKTTLSSKQVEELKKLLNL